jgi:hypothetical protein
MNLNFKEMSNDKERAERLAWQSHRMQVGDIPVREEKLRKMYTKKDLENAWFGGARSEAGDFITFEEWFKKNGK